MGLHRHNSMVKGTIALTRVYSFDESGRKDER